jgi:hypothetical protein
MKLFKLAFFCFLLLATKAIAGNTTAPEGASAYLISPRHGEVVTSPVKVVFGLTGMGVAPAGTDRDKTGHHHLLIDTQLPDLNTPIPSDDNHRHFGGGQTEVIIELPAGTHSLQLLLADFAHIPHNPAVTSQQITITVK